ncbi:hypothetical protein HQM25_06830 [Microbacterium hominis]|uniref:Uncharacterized protein n=1 Tax=Microbacterium hominis TaxID=162426 RepID=A0A7D4QLR2_9MICO|nr:hypothetical protein [Microbacterium hominis]QKJ21136.1 hypothetical protein HQM25_06830 [Microbacterium hominis]
MTAPDSASPHRTRAATAARIALIYLAARAVTTVFLLVAAELSGSGSRFGPDATLADLLGGWDAAWYGFLALTGYPTELPVTETGEVAENAWAFMPVFAYLALAVGTPFGDWLVGAVAISLAAGYGACLVLHAMLRDRLADAAALWAVAFFASGPLAALFHVGYAESLFLLLLFLALWAVMRRRFAWLLLLVPLMGYTRPGVLAFALFLGVYTIVRWFARRRDPFPMRDIVLLVAAGLLAVAVGFSWQVIAAVATGDPDAYLATELAWRRGWVGGEEHFVPFSGFVQGAALWFELWGLGAVAGYVALALLVGGFAALLLFSGAVRALGIEVRLWAASYALYLLAVFFPQSSTFRLLVPLSPLWGAFAVPRSPWWRSGVLALCLVGQWWWIYNMYALGNAFWQIP